MPVPVLTEGFSSNVILGLQLKTEKIDGKWKFGIVRNKKARVYEVKCSKDKAECDEIHKYLENDFA